MVRCQRHDITLSQVPDSGTGTGYGARQCWACGLEQEVRGIRRDLHDIKTLLEARPTQTPEDERRSREISALLAQHQLLGG